VLYTAIALINTVNILWQFLQLKEAITVNSKSCTFKIYNNKFYDTYVIYQYNSFKCQTLIFITIQLNVTVNNFLQDAITTTTVSQPFVWYQWVSWYQKKHLPTHNYSDHQPSFISFLDLL